MDLIESPNVQRIAADVFERRPELVARVETVMSDSRAFFPDQDVALEDRQFDDWDPLITLVLYAYMPFDAYFAARDRFREWLWEKNWVTDGDLKITEAHAGETR